MPESEYLLNLRKQYPLPARFWEHVQWERIPQELLMPGDGPAARIWGLSYDADANPSDSRTYESDNPMRTARISVLSQWAVPALMSFGRLGGVAVVHQRGELMATLLGRESNITRLSDVWAQCRMELLDTMHALPPAAGLGGPKWRRWLYALPDLYARRWLTYEDDPGAPYHMRRSTRQAPEKERREGVPRLTHWISQHYPQLREWDRPNPPEVWLKEADGSLALGGVVWIPEYYHEGKHWNNYGGAPWTSRTSPFLDVTTPFPSGTPRLPLVSPPAPPR